jgi:hypothetical protein
LLLRSSQYVVQNSQDLHGISSYYPVVGRAQRAAAAALPLQIRSLSAGTIETFGRATAPQRQEERRLASSVAWPCSCDTVLALTLRTVVLVAAAKKLGRRSRRHREGRTQGRRRHGRTAAATAPPPGSGDLPSACETTLTSAEARSAWDPFAASVQFAMAQAITTRTLSGAQPLCVRADRAADGHARLRRAARHQPGPAP